MSTRCPVRPIQRHPHAFVYRAQNGFVSAPSPSVFRRQLETVEVAIWSWRENRAVLRISTQFTTDPVKVTMLFPEVSRTGWRRRWDSNPRYGVTVYTLSRRAPSTTRPRLRISIRATAPLLERVGPISRSAPLASLPLQRKPHDGTKCICTRQSFP